MKFKVDENLPDELVDFLRNAGWDSMSIVEQELGGALDPRVAEVCSAEDRILVTFDGGFANVVDYPPSANPGMIVSVEASGQGERSSCERASHPAAA